MDATILSETSPNGIEGLGISFWDPNLTQSVLNGSVPEWRLDDMATRIMAAYFYLGQDQDFPPLNFAQGDLSTYGYLYGHAMADYTQINEQRCPRPPCRRHSQNRRQLDHHAEEHQ